MNQANSRNREYKNTISFPTWKALIALFCHKHLVIERNSVKNVLKETYDGLEKMKAVIKDFHPIKLLEIQFESNHKYLVDVSYEELLKKFSVTCIAKNEFYSVFDMQKCYHVIVDDRIMEVLGIEKSNFSMAAMAGFDVSNPLYHPDDLNHTIRWACVGYMLLAFPGFSWTTLVDYYQVSFRVGTKKSCISQLNKAEYVMLEKRCYPLNEIGLDGRSRPTHHFDRWTIYPASQFENVHPRWISAEGQSDLMNSICYLFNSYLLGISPKHLAILHERQTLDRGKAIANNVNEKIKKYSNLKADFDDFQISNALSKTIRSKVALAMNTWDKRSIDNQVEIKSDQEAVHYARVLGLLPIPDLVEELIFSSVIEGSSKASGAIPD